MDDVVVNRPPRRHGAAPEATTLTLAAPPSPPPQSGATTLVQALIPAFGALGMVLFLIANGNPIFLLAGIVLVAATVGGAIAWVVMSRTGARRAFRLARERYLEYLDEVRSELREVAARQRDYTAQAHRPPRDLAIQAVGPRVYERRLTDRDFGAVRVGLGRVAHPVHVRIPKPSSPLERTDPVCHRAAVSLVSAHRHLAGQPLTVPLAEADSVVISATTYADALAVTRALLMQAACLHSPQDLRIGVASPAIDDEFAFARWLPHTADTDARDGVLPRAWLTRDVADLLEEMREHLTRRLKDAEKALRVGVPTRHTGRIVVIVDEWDTGPTGVITVPDSSTGLAHAGVCIVRLVARADDEPESVDVRVAVDGNAVRLDGASLSVPFEGVSDRPSHAETDSLARALAARPTVADEAPAEPLIHDVSPATILGITDPEQWTPQVGWQEKSRRELLRVSIGLRSDGKPLVLDLKESAFDGMGPHGLLVGATGSGKSELLRSLVLALAATHSPEQLAFVLVDYKGGATFAGLEDLPHVSGVITNLADDLALVDRMRDALFGEITRRQETLHGYGHLPNVFAYDALRREQPDMPPLPHLLVIVDEFAELLTAKPDFNDLFTSIGRIGRSIGVHQLLASQRLDDGRLRGLESFLSYRLALRTFNSDESRAVIGSAAAFELPALPGSGYLKVDTTLFERFKSAYVSAPYQPPRAVVRTETPVVQLLRTTNSTPRHAEPLTRTVADAAEGGPTILDVAVDRMRGQHDIVHQIWLPPLPSALSLTQTDAIAPSPAPALTARVGIVDIPSEQRQEPLDLDFAGNAAHVALLGGPRSGTSTALRTIAVALARTHAPGEISIHVVDFGGGALRDLDRLPHVGTVAGRLDLDRIRRIFAELVLELDRRESLFAREGVVDAAAMRRRFHEGTLPALDVVDVFLLIDDYTALRNEHDELHDQLVKLVARGAAYGLHVVLTAGRWWDLRPALQTTMPTRIELRLNDPIDSVLDRRLSGGLDSHTPGRAVIDTGRLAHFALPSTRVGADPEAEARSTLDEIAAAHEGRSVASVRLLPLDLRLDEVPPLTVDDRVRPAEHDLTPLVLGLAEDTLAPVPLDLAGADPHLIVFGDQKSGKTSLLRSLTQQLVNAHTDDELVVVLIDPRRTMLGHVPDDYLGAYAPNATAAAGLATQLAAELAKRQPTSTDPAALATHRWSGPQIVCVVDDMELITGPIGNPLDALQPYLPSAQDLGFHLVLSRHAGGAGRALFEPTLQRVKELGSPGLLLSGDPDEGHLWPKTPMTPLPPGRARLVRRGTAARLLHLARP